ncbi:hypothetical protein DFH06DRAFT_144861 [Mycena polygramma]|nr:hypothetical protein DFH06DRAFT_144861 [Mycena polygramma]
MTSSGLLPKRPLASPTMWAVFLTPARPPPPKALNRAFLLIQDFEFTRYPAESQWTLLTSTNLPSAPPPATPVPVPLPEITTNAFASMSPAQINTFIRANEAAFSQIKLSRRNWIVIDQHGLESSTCLVCEQIYDPSGDGELGKLTSGVSRVSASVRGGVAHDGQLGCGEYGV